MLFPRLHIARALRIRRIGHRWFLCALYRSHPQYQSMPILLNPRWEQFAQGIVARRPSTRAYVDAGFSPQGAAQAAHKLLRHPQVADRIAELRRMQRQAEIIAAEAREKEVLSELVRPVVQHSVNKDWVRGRLQTIVERCMQHEPVLQACGDPLMVEGPDGKLHALYGFDAKNAIAALHLLGKLEGMLTEHRDAPKGEPGKSRAEQEKELDDFLAQIEAKQVIRKAQGNDAFSRGGAENPKTIALRGSTKPTGDAQH